MHSAHIVLIGSFSKSCSVYTYFLLSLHTHFTLDCFVSFFFFSLSLLFIIMVYTFFFWFCIFHIFRCVRSLCSPLYAPDCFRPYFSMIKGKSIFIKFIYTKILQTHTQSAHKWSVPFTVYFTHIRIIISIIMYVLGMLNHNKNTVKVFFFRLLLCHSVTRNRVSREGKSTRRKSFPQSGTCMCVCALNMS